MRSSSTRVARLLADLATALESLGLRYYLFGAQASIVHGAARLTADVDVTVDTGKVPSNRVISELRRRGFRPALDDPAFIELTRVIPLIHEKTRMPVDLVLAGPGLEDLFFQNAQKVKIGRKLINVAAAEDLIVMKALAGRPKDVEDIRALLAARGNELDLAAIRATLAIAEELLDQSDLLPLFEGLVAEGARALRKMRSPAEPAVRRRRKPRIKKKPRRRK